MLERLRKSSDKLLTGLDRLTESDELLSNMLIQLRGLEGKEIDSLKKVTKAMQDSTKNIREMISGKTSERQGITASTQITVIGLMQTAQSYITNKTVAPGMQEEQLVKNAEDYIGAAVQRINRFYAGEWSGYRRLVESTKLNLFKDYKAIQ